ncbi:MAG TPA: hypothetical protein VET48_06405 [Steroidobacteraceae bacterium]|nr:hypothetical protein [Steroidobacteraceae bacterium]
MMIKMVSAGIATASLLMITQFAFAEEHADRAALAKAVAPVSVSLQQGLTASEKDGKPISAKFELDEGALQLSVYTSNGKAFSEVIVDHQSAAIKKSEVITDAGDLKHAHSQLAAVAKAKRSLAQAVESAVQANSGYRAVSAVPTMKANHPVANVMLVKGAQFKTVVETLD